MKSISSVALIIVGKSIAGGGGAERRFIRLWKFFILNNTPIHMIINHSLYRSTIEADLLNESDIESEWLHIIPDSSPLSLSKMIFKTIKKYKISLVHLVLAQKTLLPLYIILKYNSSIITTHTVALSWFAHPYKVPFLTHLLNKFLWATSKKIDSLYEGFLKQNKHFFNNTSKVSISPCSFTDIQKFNTDHKKEKIIVFAGRLISEKNPLLFINALKLMNPEILKGWKIIIAGSGPLEKKITDELKNTYLETIVSIITCADMSKLFQKSAIFVSLQKTENYPSQSLLEAMVSNNTVVATNSGETTRLIHHNETGFLIDSNPHQLADTLSYLISNKLICEEIAARGKKFVVSNHRIERFAEYIKEFWESAL